MDFCVATSSDVINLRAQIDQNHQLYMWGFGRVHYTLMSLLGAILSISTSLMMVYTLFTLKVPQEAGGFTILNHPIVNLVMLGIFIFLAMFSSILSKKTMEFYNTFQDKFKRMNQIYNFYGKIIFENRRMKDIRMYNQLDVANKFYDFKANQLEYSFNKKCRAGYTQSQMVSSLATGFTYVFVCIKAITGAFSIGMVTQYIASLSQMGIQMEKLLATIIDLKNNTIYLKTTLEYMEMKNVMYRGSLTTEKRSDKKYDIEFKNVSFHYPGTTNDVISNLSLKFEIGKKIAVVGENGSGKTTFINLLCRLYNPTQGEILLNGININKYDYLDYLGIFAIVFQDFKLFAYTLGENVGVSSDYDRDLAKECLLKAGFGERLVTMPKGLDTFLYRDLNEEGITLSGGEEQKIALARALYRNAAFMILDELTAALDPIAESEIYEQFNSILGEATAVYISHRLSSCKFCDEILVFDGGNLVESGNHEKLLRENGKYSSLWEAQAQYYR